MLLLFMLVSMLLILLLGFPMYMTLGLTSVLVMFGAFADLNPIVIMQQLIDGVSSFVLLAIPMYLFAADIMTRGFIATRLIDLVKAFVGHVYGGLGISMAGACTVFGAISGSTQATVAAIGKPMRENLISAGYNRYDVNALIISAANLATLIPPSLGMIIYCVLTSVSVGELFMAGVGPGLFIFLMFSVYNYFHSKKQGIPRSPKMPWLERLKCLKRALLALGFPVIIIGGIYSGFFSPTEAAAVSVLYAVVCEVLIYRSVAFRDLYRIALDTGAVTSALFILIAVGQAFSWLLTYARVPQLLTVLFLGPNPSAIHILYVVTIFFFFACMFVDPIVANLILVPIFYPVAMRAGIDPIHLGIVVTLQSGVGGITPPFGSNIFVACAVFNETYWDVIRRVLPYFLMFIGFSILLIHVPQIATIYRYVF